MSVRYVPPWPTPSSSHRLASAKLPPAVRIKFLSASCVKLPDQNDDRPRLVAMAGGGTIVATMIDMDGERIHLIFAVSNPDMLRAIGATHPMPV